jgi:outer membrane receptor protein involved in Fe transport
METDLTRSGPPVLMAQLILPFTMLLRMRRATPTHMSGEAAMMDVRCRVLLAIWLLVAVMAAPSALAQSAGRVEGRLTRSDGTGLSGATVTIVSTGVSTLTGADGRYVIEAASPGPFSVTFSLGANLLTIDDVRLEGGRSTLDRTVDWQVGYTETITVYAASRRTERLFEAPASVAIVNESTIAREAAHGQVPKLLAATPGVELAQSGVFDFNVNIRGLNAALTRRVLTLVDARDPASVLIGAQEWAAFGVPLDDLARIEVVRGPGAALYGTNAFNGVIDITSREPRFSQGGHAEVTAGEIGTIRVSARHAGAIAATTFYRVHTGYGRTDDFFASRVASREYPGLPPEVAGLQRDRTEFVNWGGRIDRYFSAGRHLTVEGGSAHTDGSVFLTGAGRLQNTGAHRPWARAALQTARWRMSGYYDGRYGDMASLTAGQTIVDRSMKASADVSRRFDFRDARSRFVLGGAYRLQRADTRDEQGHSTILRDVERADETSAFAQLDHAITDRVKLVAATRLDDSTLHHLEVSPKAALVFSSAPTQSLRLTYGHAFQTGSLVHYFTRTAAAAPVALGAVEQALRPVLGGATLGLASVPVLALGNDRLKNERVDSLEIGYAGAVKGQLLVAVNYYFNRISDLITPLIAQVGTELGRINPGFQPYAPPASLSAAQQALVLATVRASLPPSLFALMSNDLDGSPIFAVASYTNLAGANLQGAEASVQYFASNRVSADAGYSTLHFTPRARLIDPLVTANAPAHKLTAGVTYAGAKLTAALRYRWSADFFWNGGIYRGPVPAATVVDLTGRYRLRERTTLQLNVANLFDNEHYELFGGDILRRRALVSLIQSW